MYDSVRFLKGFHVRTSFFLRSFHIERKVNYVFKVKLLFAHQKIQGRHKVVITPSFRGLTGNFIIISWNACKRRSNTQICSLWSTLYPYTWEIISVLTNKSYVTSHVSPLTFEKCHTRTHSKLVRWFDLPSWFNLTSSLNVWFSAILEGIPTKDS